MGAGKRGKMYWLEIYNSQPVHFFKLSTLPKGLSPASDPGTNSGLGASGVCAGRSFTPGAGRVEPSNLGLRSHVL